MSIHWRETVREALPVLLGVVLSLSGFVLLRVSAIYENWLLLFLAFGFMLWGLVMLFTGRVRPSSDTWHER